MRHPYPPEEVSLGLKIMAIATEGMLGPQRQLKGKRVAKELEQFRELVRTNAKLEVIKDIEKAFDD